MNTPKHGKNRLCLDLSGDHPAEAARIQAAGAHPVGTHQPNASQAHFTDPEDNEFGLLLSN